MSTELKHLLIILGAIAVILILIILLFGGKSPIMKFLNLFLEETDAGGHGSSRSGGTRSGTAQRNSEPAQKKTAEPIVVMATLVQKCDDRLRVIESSGQVKLIDEYYELVFMTRKGQKLKVQCSRDAYETVPFNQQGSLTYKRNTLVKFKYYEDTIYNN